MGGIKCHQLDSEQEDAGPGLETHEAQVGVRGKEQPGVCMCVCLCVRACIYFLLEVNKRCHDCIFIL